MEVSVWARVQERVQTGFGQGFSQSLDRAWTGCKQDSSMGLGKVLGRAQARVQTEFGQGFGQRFSNGSAKVWVRV